MDDKFVNYIKRSNKKFFQENQRILLELVNTPELREILGITDPRIIVKVFPNGWSFLDKIDKKGNVTLTGHFFCYEKAAKYLGPLLTRTPWYSTNPKRKQSNVENIRDYLGLTGIRPIPMGLTTTNFYAGAGDGEALKQNATYSTAHNAASADSVDYTTGNTNMVFNEHDGAQYNIVRSYFPTDTSAIGSAPTISAANMNYQLSSTNSSGVDDKIQVVSTTQASTTQLVVGDYSQVGTGNGGQSGNLSTLSTSAYNITALTATGIGYISQTGTTKIGMRMLGDVNATDPGSGKRCNAVGYFSEQTGTSKDPYIDVTYSTGGGGAFLLNLL